MRRFRVVITPEAQADLDSLYAYIADQTGKKVAQAFIDRLRDYCLGLSHAPQRGQRRDDLLPGLRLLGYRRQATIALITTVDEVAVLRVLYRGRDVEAVLTGDDEKRA